MTHPTDPNAYIPVYTAYGRLAGEMIRLMLESMEIPALLSQESAGAAIGLTIGPLGEVKILVPASRANEARGILQDLEEGRLDHPVLPDLQTTKPAYKSNKLNPDEIYKE